ncbi:MAG TPA: O-antigen ligase family protein [Candidatus Xenobia bacterium]|jgi:hypothetical protein
MKGKQQQQARLIGLFFALAPVGVFLYLLALASPLLAFILYCCLYVGVASVRPSLALMLLFASAPFNQDLSGGMLAHFSLAELNLALAFPICIFHGLKAGRPLRLGPISTWVTLYFVVCIVSSALTWHNSAVISFLQMGIYMVCAVIVFSSWLENPADYRLILEAAAVMGVVLAVLGTFSGFSFPALHKNVYGAALANQVIIFTELWLSSRSKAQGRFLLLGLLIVGGALLLTLSRGGWLGALVGVMVIFACRRRFGTLVKLALIMTPILALLWVGLPQESRDYATNFSASRWNIKLRLKTLDQTRAMFDESPLFGTGLGVRKELDATNLVLVTLAETGILGCLTFLGIHLAVLRFGLQTLKRNPGEGSTLVVLAVALLAARFAHGLVDEYWSRGALMQAWGAVGMGTYVYYLVAPSRRRSQA